MKYNLKTFCPLPWMHFSARPDGIGRLCCEADDMPLKDNDGRLISWKDFHDFHSYFNSEDYKKIRLQMLNGERPPHCTACFRQEDNGTHSKRMLMLSPYKNMIDKLLKSTHPDGSIDYHPRSFYIDMALGNKCNLKCRMCHPGSSYLIGKDWEQMGKPFDKKLTKGILRDKWYASPGFFHLVQSSLPFIREMAITGGEPFLIKEHLQILEMAVKEGHADHILLRYNTNQTVIPDKMVNLWKSFKRVDVTCSVEAFGKLNDYIRYPSKWKELEKNMYYLDDIAFRNSHIKVFIHTTFQAYNVLRIPEFLGWLKEANFKVLHRFPSFVWIRFPDWLCASIYPRRFRDDIANKITESLDHYESFFLSYNEGSHRGSSRDKIQVLREFVEMLRRDSSHEQHFKTFIKETRAHDALRNQSVTHVLPELNHFFNAS